MHDVLTIGIPLFVILAGILFHRHEVKELRTEMREGFSRVDARFDRIDADLRQFYSISGKLEGRIDEISKRQG